MTDNVLTNPFHPYLHNTAEHFRWQGSLQLRHYNKNAIATKKLEDWREQCLLKEQAFLSDFNVTSFHQWEEEYLIHTAANQKASTLYEEVLKTINSRDLLNRLRAYDFTPQTFVDFLSEKSEKKLSQTVINKLLQSQSFDEAVGKYVVEGLSLKGKNIAVKQVKNYNKLVGYLNNSELQQQWTGLLRSYKSNYLSDLKKAIKQEAANYNGIIEDTTQFLRRKLEQYYNNKPNNTQKQEIEYYCNEWKKALQEELNNETEKRLLSFNDSNIIGEIGEIGDAIVFSARAQQDENLKQLETTIVRRAKNKVNRFGKTVESKTDLQILTKNGKYNIQEKNSMSSIYQEFENSIYKDAEKNIFGGITLQGEIAYPQLRTYLSKIRNSTLTSFLSDDAAALSYLLVNISVLNKYGQVGNKFYKSARQNPNTAANIGISEHLVRMIDDILSQNIGLYVSDVLNAGTDNLTLEPYDFIIFKSRKIIPMSAILECLITAFKEENQKIFDLHTSFYVGNEAGAVYRQMLKEKNLYTPKLQKGQAWYSDPSFVNIGQQAGQEVLQNIKINKIRLNLHYKQTFSTNSKNIVGRIY